MSRSEDLLRDLSEDALTRVGERHDEARLRYRLRSNTVRDGAEFEQAIGDYVAYDFSECVVPGGVLPRATAIGRAKQMIESGSRRRNQTLQNAIANGVTGANAGMRGILDLLADQLKQEQIGFYIEDTFSKHLPIGDFEASVEMMKDVIEHYGHILPENIRNQRPEKWALNYKELVQSLADSIRQAAGEFRRI